MGEDRTPPERRLTVADAAQELGISAEAVRSRVKRGSLESAKEGRTVYVLLPHRPDDARTTTKHDQTSAQTGARGDAQAELVESLLDQISYMREQLAEEREARRRADTIIAQLSQANAALASRVPEIEAPRDPSEAPEATGAPETASERPGRDDISLGDPEPHHPVERPSWWRRFFGFE